MCGALQTGLHPPTVPANPMPLCTLIPWPEGLRGQEIGKGVPRAETGAWPQPSPGQDLATVHKAAGRRQRDHETPA